jgi:Fe2+ transport system protein FeoA
LRFSLNKELKENGVKGEASVYSDALMPVELLNAGAWAEVVDVTGEPHCVNRLAEMGLQAGCRVRVLQSGTPCLLQVAGARLSLRSDCRLQLLVRPVALAG